MTGNIAVCQVAEAGNVGRKDGSQPPFDTRLARAMSALPPEADIGSAFSNVRYGPKADIDRLRGPLTKHFSLRQELCRIPSIFQALLSSALWLVCR